MSLDTRGVQIPNGSKNPDDEHVKPIEIVSHEGSLREAKFSVVNYYMHWFQGY